MVINGINYKDKPEAALALLDELGNPYAKIGADSGRMALNWGVYGVPETYVIDGKGKVVLALGRTDHEVTCWKRPSVPPWRRRRSRNDFSAKNQPRIFWRKFLIFRRKIGAEFSQKTRSLLLEPQVDRTGVANHHQLIAGFQQVISAGANRLFEKAKADFGLDPFSAAPHHATRQDGLGRKYLVQPEMRIALTLRFHGAKLSPHG